MKWTKAIPRLCAEPASTSQQILHWVAQAHLSLWINIPLWSVSVILLDAVDHNPVCLLSLFQEKGWREAVLETGFQDKVSELGRLSVGVAHLRIAHRSHENLYRVLFCLPARLTLGSSLLMPHSESRTLTSMWKKNRRGDSIPFLITIKKLY